MTFKTVARGDTIESLDDNHRIFRSKKEFWIGPFALLRPGDCFFFDRKCHFIDHEGDEQDGRVVVMPCGYSEIDDVEIAHSEEGLQRLVDDAWIEEINREGEVVTRPSRWEVLSRTEDTPWWKRLLERLS